MMEIKEKKAPVVIESAPEIQKTSAVDTVIHKIREMVKNGQLKSGDKLPNETELSRVFGTSRGPIREAVKALVALGILEIKRGDGTYISVSSAKTAVDQLLFQLLLSKTEQKELRELRYMMELGMVDSILKNAQPDDIREMESLNARMEELIKMGDQDTNAITQLDLAFHKVMGRSTKNSLLEKIYGFTLELFSVSIEKTHLMPQAGDISTRVHKAVLEGIKERDQEKTKDAILQSLKVWESLSL
ncbi:MAG: GntR family transcriptional regulator [Spirochaetia bacterium]|jgi:DNA-binding FadR family transcriptional regulator